jgi:hypothetical protein
VTPRNLPVTDAFELAFEPLAQRITAKRDETTDGVYLDAKFFFRENSRQIALVPHKADVPITTALGQSFPLERPARAACFR